MTALAVREIRDRVDAVLPDFLEKVLNFSCDAIVAIESEGAATLLNYLREHPRPGHPPVVPDTLVEEVGAGLEGKRVLVFDSSAISGRKLRLTTEMLSRYNADYSTAVLLLQQDHDREIQPTMWGVELPARQYPRAKSRLIEILLGQPYPITGDHLIYILRFDNTVDIPDFLRAAGSISTSYLVSDPSARVARFTVDSASPNPESDLSRLDLWFESVCKLRIYADTETNEIVLIPMVFPAVPLITLVKSRNCPYCEFASGLGIPILEQHNETSVHCFRRVAYAAQVLLAESFVRKLLPLLPHGDVLCIEPPNEDILRGSTSLGYPDVQLAADVAHDRLTELLNSWYSGGQMHLWEEGSSAAYVFSDKLLGHLIEGTRERSDPIIPWELTSIAVGNWYEQLREHVSDLEDRERLGIPFSAMCARLSGELEPVLVSYSIDALVDEHMLRPRVAEWRGDFGKPEGGRYLVRGYQPGGEYIRMQMLALSAAARGELDWFRKQAEKPRT